MGVLSEFIQGEDSLINSFADHTVKILLWRCFTKENSTSLTNTFERLFAIHHTSKSTILK